MTVKIAGSFKRDDRPRNGLEAIHDQLIAEAEDAAGTDHVVVALVRARRAEVDAEDGVKTPTVKFSAIEVVGGEDAATVRAILAKVYRERTGLIIGPDLIDAANDLPDDDDAPQGDAWLGEQG